MEIIRLTAAILIYLVFWAVIFRIAAYIGNKLKIAETVIAFLQYLGKVLQKILYSLFHKQKSSGER